MSIPPAMMFRAIISVVIILLFGSALIGILFFGLSITSDSKEIVLYLFGILSAAMAAVVGFWLGSSQGSVDKDKPK